MKALKEELFRWTCEKHATNSFPDRSLLREKALQLTKSYSLNGFKCSNSWLTHFLKEHGFSKNSMNQGGPVFDDYRRWIDMMRPTITKYKHSDLFHVDELAMYSDVPPSKSLSNGAKDSLSSEPRKNRITILMGCNSSGTTKLPLLICGPYLPKSRTKEHDYYRNETSRIEDDLFRNWLVNLDDRMAKYGRKILLFLRRNRAHALKDFVPSNVQLLYFPEDFPTLLRPLRREVFHYVKMVFRRRYIQHMEQSASEWNLDDILSCVIEAWETVPRELIVFSFQRTQFRTDDYFLQIDCDRWDRKKAGISFKRFVTFDDDLSDRQTSNSMNDVHSGCNLGKDCKNIIDIDEDSRKYVRVAGENIGSTGSKNLSHESGRDSRISLGRRNYTDRNLNDTAATVQGRMLNDKDRIAMRKPLEATPIEGSRKRKKSPKKTYSEARVSTKGRSGNRRAPRDRIMTNILVRKVRTAGLPRFARNKVVKERRSEKLQLMRNSLKKSVKTVTYRGLTLSSSTKTHGTEKLIDRVCTSNWENTGNANRWAESKHSTEQRPLELLECCTNMEGVQSKHMDTAEEGTNEIDSHLSNSLSDKFNQPSSSMNNWQFLLKEIDQSASEETSEKRDGNVTVSSNVPKLEEQNHISYRDSKLATNLNNESDTFSLREEVLQFSRKKRRRSEDTNDSKDDFSNGEPGKKEAKVDHDWSKEFENTFVFGSVNANCSCVQQQDESVVDPCIFTIRPTMSPRD